jgi:hypothetical protein
MVRYLNFIIVIIFGFITFKTIQNATGQAAGLGTWFLPLSLVCMSIPVIYGIIKFIKAK